MRFAVEAWDAAYGSPVDDSFEESEADIDAGPERALDDWRPVDPHSGTRPFIDVLFVDGVQRREAPVWVRDDNGIDRQGICVSVAAGAVRCTDVALVVEAQVERYLFTSSPSATSIATRHGTYDLRYSDDRPEKQSELLNTIMGDLERRVASAAGSADAVVVDGPLKAGQHTGELIGYIKTHHTSYGRGDVGGKVRSTVQALGVGQRTPVFSISGQRPRWSWYLRLPCQPDHGLAGVVRLEIGARPSINSVVELADRLSTTLPRFASVPHKDPRAPQNLYPIAGLERELRRRLGDRELLYRSLRVASAGSRGSLANVRP